MRYKIKKETKPTLPTFGKYKAVAVHNQVVDSRVIAKEACRGTTLSPGAMEGLMMTLGSVVMRRLQMGDKVRLAGIGLLKLEIESEKVDDPKQFRAQKHIRGVRLHLIPETSFLRVKAADLNSTRVSLSSVTSRRIYKESLRMGTSERRHILPELLDYA